MNTAVLMIPSDPTLHALNHDAPDTQSDLPECPITGRPLWGKMPIPWITRWTGEYSFGALAYAYLNGEEWICYGDPTTNPFGIEAAIKGQRDELGLLWSREFPDGQGYGEPEFRQIQASRQRACIMDRRCQVCGNEFPGEDVTFLLPEPKDHEDRRGKPFWTMDAPVCDTCIPITLGMCPDMHDARRMVIRATAYRPHAIRGDIMTPFGVGDVGTTVMLDDPVITHMLAKQLGVLVTRYEREPAPEPYRP